jgi:hypothetical protein
MKKMDTLTNKDNIGELINEVRILNRSISCLKRESPFLEKGIIFDHLDNLDYRLKKNIGAKINNQKESSDLNNIRDMKNQVKALKKSISIIKKYTSPFYAVDIPLLQSIYDKEIIRIKDKVNTHYNDPTKR